jgi:thiosulfate/3-mercaptopyruvate sulfurtransferase
MKKLKYFISIITVAFLFIGVSFAQDLISVKELSGKLKDDNVVLVSAQKADKYAAVHIKGSVNIPPSELVNNEPIKYVNKSTAEIAKILGDNGISADKEIVLYDNGSSKYSGRMYWELKYMGAKDVKILNGEMEAWKAGRKPITKTPTSPAATTFTADVQPQYLAKMDEVKKATAGGNYVLVDARTAEEFNGTDEETELRRGHIPGAVNVDYKLLLDSKGKLKSKEALTEIYNAQGVTSDKTIIVYCATSVRAGIEFMALSSILEYPNVKLYDGAFTEWQTTASNEVVK